MDEENNKPRAGVSRSFIFAIFIVLAIIGVVAYFIFTNTSSAKTLQDNAFIYYLSNGKVTDVQIVLAETETSANGHVLLVDSKGNEVKKTFKTSLPSDAMSNEYTWSYDSNGDGTNDFSVTSLEEPAHYFSNVVSATAL